MEQPKILPGQVITFCFQDENEKRRVYKTVLDLTASTITVPEVKSLNGLALISIYTGALQDQASYFFEYEYVPLEGVVEIVKIETISVLGQQPGPIETLDGISLKYPFCGE